MEKQCLGAWGPQVRHAWNCPSLNSTPSFSTRSALLRVKCTLCYEGHLSSSLPFPSLEAKPLHLWVSSWVKPSSTQHSSCSSQFSIVLSPLSKTARCPQCLDDLQRNAALTRWCHTPPRPMELRSTHDAQQFCSHRRSRVIWEIQKCHLEGWLIETLNLAPKKVKLKGISTSSMLLSGVNELTS